MSLTVQQQQIQLQHIPELIEHIGTYLDQPSLYACIQVSRLWHNTLLPALYRTLRDDKCCWTQILVNLAPGKAKYKNLDNWTEEFIREVLDKNGGHIRHLRVSWAILSNAASTSSTCTQLRSLEIRGLSRARRLLEQTCFTTYRYGRPTGTSWDRVEPMLSPLFAGPFVPIIRASLAWSQQDWISFQRFWMLVYNNSSTLQRLRLDCSIGRMKSLPEELFDLLASCRRLTHLENNYQPMDLQRLLDRMPGLLHYSDSYSLLDMGVLERTMPQLRSLTLWGQLPTRSIFLFLKHLPNLEQLTVGWKFVYFLENPGSILDYTPSRLRGLHFRDHSIETADDYIATSILPWLPNLVELTLSHLGPLTAAALPVHCRQFETFRQYILSDSIHPSYQMKTKTNVLGLLLEKCPNLKTIDAIQHILEVEYLSTSPAWICQSLENFRCQIRGISRLSNPDLIFDYRQGRFNTMIDQPLSPDQEHALQLFKSGREQQCLVLVRLSQLVHLKTLDLGMEYRKIGAGYGRMQPYYRVGSKRYVDYGAPLPDTMELSLESGLDQLKTLKELEVFGFEGCDHRIDLDDIQWMAESWPRLREMRGLQKVHLHSLETDIHTERLRLRMLRLRPSVKHQKYQPPPSTH
ncbi:hypothetical protein BGX29_006779 [Mortierella sp. GBA35]|nr:hypothetical protein BGX29_006779 [Mortierella sp. GBA35]